MVYQLSFERLLQYKSYDSVVLPVMLRLGEKTSSFEAQLDTGASLCIFRRALGEDLGIEIENGIREQINTVTGSFVAYGHQLTLSVLERDFEAYVYFAANEQFTRNVLGRTGWLDRFRVGLIYYDREIYLSPYGSVDA
jgi:hypothetical protein